MTSRKPGWFAKILREPFLHFVVLGTLIFIFNTFATRWTDPTRIEINSDDVARLKAQFIATWGREPNPSDLTDLENGLLREEVLYREALANGLGRDDTIIRRRLAQKMEYLATANVSDPTEAEIESYYHKHTAKYATLATVNFTQLYFGAGADAPAAARRALVALEHGKTVAGEPILLPRNAINETHDDVARDFGNGFAAALATPAIGIWFGPVRSAYGIHLVRIDARTTAGTNPLELVRDRVRSDLLDERLTEAREAQFDRALSTYKVTIDGAPLPERSKTGMQEP